MIKERIEYLDIARCIGIFFMILSHMTEVADIYKEFYHL